MNWEKFQRNRLWPNRGTIPVTACKNISKPREAVTTADIPVYIRTEDLPNRSPGSSLQKHLKAKRTSVTTADIPVDIRTKDLPPEAPIALCKNISKQKKNLSHDSGYPGRHSNQRPSSRSPGSSLQKHLKTKKTSVMTADIPVDIRTKDLPPEAPVALCKNISKPKKPQS
jgi:hypothetical protein